MNFLGTNLSFAYNGYSNSNPFREYADFFTVTGTIGGVANNSYNLYIRNGSGVGGTANSAPRQLAFNGVVVPEASAFVLALPALGMIGAVTLHRRQK